MREVVQETPPVRSIFRVGGRNGNIHVDRDGTLCHGLSGGDVCAGGRRLGGGTCRDQEPSAAVDPQFRRQRGRLLEDQPAGHGGELHRAAPPDLSRQPGLDRRVLSVELWLRVDDDHAGGRVPRHAAVHPRAAARLPQRRAAPEGDGARLPRPDRRLLPHERHGGVRVDPGERHARRQLLHPGHESAAQLSLPEMEGRASGMPVRQLFEQAAVLRLVGGRLREPHGTRLHEEVRDGFRGELRRGRHRVRLLPARTAVQDRRLGRVRDRGAAEGRASRSLFLSVPPTRSPTRRRRASTWRRGSAAG